MENLENYLFYYGRGNKELGHQVLRQLGELLGQPLKFNFIDFGTWRDGCPNDKIVDFNEVRGKNIIFFDSLTTKTAVLDYLSLAYAFKHQYHAGNLIAVNPFILTRRCDHEEKKEEIQYLRQYLKFLSTAGVSELVAVTPHSDYMGQVAEEYGMKFHPVYTDFSRTLKTIVPKNERILVYSPDKGSIPRAIAHAKKIPASTVVFDLKLRKSNNKTEIVQAEQDIINEIKFKYSQEFDFNIDYIKYISEIDITGANIIMIDDELSSGGTAIDTAKKLMGIGAKAVYFAFTHAVCSNGWKPTLFSEPIFTKILAQNTIIRDEENRTGGRIIDVSANEVIAAALYEIIMRDSIAK